MNALQFMEFKKSDPQYKKWESMLRSDYPNLFRDQIEMIIYGHMSDPQAYKRDRQYKATSIPTPTKFEQPIASDGGFRVYSGPDDPDLPASKPMKYADGVTEPCIIVDSTEEMCV